MDSFLRLNWRAACIYMTRDSSWLEKVFRGGLYIALFPPLGWPLALGYRSLVATQLVEGTEPLLPKWSGNHLEIHKRGWGAIGVIFSYLLPFFLIYWTMGLQGDVEWWYVLLFFALCIFYPPFFVPVLPVVYPIIFDWIHFSVFESLLIFVVFLSTVFLLPAGFVQVALHGNYLDAFRIPSVLKFVIFHPVIYIEAWILSLVVSAVAVLSGIFLPWGLVWSYLAILYAFNEAFVISNPSRAQTRYKNSILLPSSGTVE